jgi:hypothetical protein
MKYFLLSILLSIGIISCTNADKEQKKREENDLLSSPIFYLYLLGNRNPSESVECGGDLIGTLFGLNNNRINRTKLEENQEITTDYNTYWYYQSSKRTIITVTLFETNTSNNNISIDCSKPGFVDISYCNGIYIADTFRQYAFKLNQVYQFEAQKNTKNFLTTGKMNDDCQTIYKIKTEVSL